MNAAEKSLFCVLFQQALQGEGWGEGLYPSPLIICLELSDSASPSPFRERVGVRVFSFFPEV